MKQNGTKNFFTKKFSLTKTKIAGNFIYIIILGKNLNSLSY